MGAARAWPTRGRAGLDQELALPEVPGQAGRARSGFPSTRRESKDLGGGQDLKSFGKYEV